MANKVKAGPDWMTKLPEHLWDYPLSSLAIPVSCLYQTVKILLVLSDIAGLRKRSSAGSNKYIIVGYPRPTHYVTLHSLECSDNGIPWASDNANVALCSHHSFSFYTDKESRVDRPSDPIYRQFVDYFGELAADISYRWTVTQSKTLTQQLNLGIRYFDMRVTSRSGDKYDKNVYLKNGPTILQALKEFRVWLDMHPTEVIIIDFRVINKMSAAQHRYLLANMTEDFFENKLLECTGHVKGVTLRNMWSLAKQVIVFYPKECIFEYSTVWPNEYIDYVISEDQSARQMIQKLDRRHQHGRPPHVFFCQNGVMTPNKVYLSEKLHGTLKENLSKPALRAILNWIRNKDIRYDEINIIVADFVDMYDFCTEVVRVNYGIRELKRYDFATSGSCTCAVL